MPNGFFDEVKEMYAGAWYTFRERFVSLIAINLVPVIFLFISFASIFAVLKLANPSVLFPLSVEHYGNQLPAFLFISGIMLLIFFISLFVASWSALALIQAAGENVPVSIQEAYHRTRHIIASYWWLLILLTIIVGGSFVFLFLPSLIFYVFFLLSPWVLVFENKKGMEALLQSRRYMMGRWWNTLGHLGAVFIIPLFISFIASLFNAAHVTILAQVCQIFVEFFYPAFAVCYLSTLYHYYVTTYAAHPAAEHSVSASKMTAREGYLAIGIAGTLIATTLFLFLASKVIPLLSL